MNPTTESEKLEVGSLLRARRVELGISLETVAEQTRIRRVYLAALEENRFDALPAATYLNGFLRSYAGALGLDPDSVLCRMRAQQAAAPADDTEPAVSSGTVSGGIKRRRSLLFVLPAGVAATAVLFFGLTGYGHRSDASTPVPAPSFDSAPAGSPLPQVAESGVLSSPGEVAAAVPEDRQLDPVTPAPELPPIPAAGGVVRLEASAPVVLEVEVDDRSPQRYDLTAESVLHWKVSHRFHLAADPPQAIALWLDDASIDLSEGSGTVLLTGRGGEGAVPQ